MSRGQDTKIPQSSGPPVKVGDEVVHKELGDRMERAATTASSLKFIPGRVLVTPGSVVVTPGSYSYYCDKKRVIIIESSIRSDLYLEDGGGIDCLPTATIFEELVRMGATKGTLHKIEHRSKPFIPPNQIIMSANDNFSLHDDEELSLHDDASLDGSVPASNKGDAPAKPP
ncbi:hypothetical protein Tco_0183501 [Tanacetum coccineum]